MSLKVRFHKIHLQTPECTILIALGMEQLFNLHESIGLDPLLVHDCECHYCDGFFGMAGENIYMWLPKEYNPVITGHECIHAANRIWDSVGANLASHNDEVITYTHDTIHRMIRNLYGLKEDNYYGTSE